MGGEGCVWAAGLGRSEALLVGVGGGVGLGCIGRLGRFGVGGIGFIRESRWGARWS